MLSTVDDIAQPAEVQPKRHRGSEQICIEEPLTTGIWELLSVRIDSAMLVDIPLPDCEADSDGGVEMTTGRAATSDYSKLASVYSELLGRIFCKSMKSGGYSNITYSKSSEGEDFMLTDCKSDANSISPSDLKD
jgi:hypothetical protein